MARASTSVCGLNADRSLSKIEQAEYFLLNWINNQLPYALVDPKLAIRDFVCPALATHWRQMPRRAAPSRTLSDLFWLTLPWTAIRNELGEVRILDAGCGSGNYGPRLLSWADSQVATYAGTDIRRQNSWADLEAATIGCVFMSRMRRSYAALSLTEQI